MSYATCDQVSPACPVELTIYGDYFTLGATATYVAVFGCMLIAQGPLLWKGRTWSYGAWLFAGTAFEFIGYVGRSVMTQNPWNFEAFIAQNLCLVLGPTLVAAAISITFKHLVLWYGPEHSILRPNLYPWVFVGTDFISICIQSAGGGLASGAGSDADLFKVGNNMLLAGVSFQVVNMTFCGGLILAYIWRRKKALQAGLIQTTHTWTGSQADLPPCRQGSASEVQQRRKKMAWFIGGLATAYMAIIFRCIYRIPEMAMGWGSTLMQNEATFMALDGAMLIIACGLLTAIHPTLFFPFMSKKHTETTTGTQEFVMASGQDMAGLERSKNSSPYASA